MADIKISALSQVSEVQSTDVVPVVSGNSTMKMSAAQVKDYCVGDLDVSDSATAGSYVTAVNETNGVIAVTREAADGTPTASSNKMVTSGGVKTALDLKANSSDVYSKSAADDLLDAKTDKSTISDAYDATKAYAVGKHFIYNDVIYTVDVACTGITPPNANYYTPNKLTDLIEANASQISTNATAISTLDIDMNTFPTKKGNFRVQAGTTIEVSISTSWLTYLVYSTYDHQHGISMVTVSADGNIRSRTDIYGNTGLTFAAETGKLKITSTNTTYVTIEAIGRT